MAKKSKKAVSKKRVRKNISTGIVHIQSTFNNTIVTIADENGNFEIKGIPQGTYQLLIWKIDHKQTIKEINVPGKGVVELDVTLPEEKSKRAKK